MGGAPGRPADPALGLGRCADLFCLLRLSEIVIADPGRGRALRAMVGELVRLARVRRSLIAVVEDRSHGRGAGLRCLARRGPPARAARGTFAGGIDVLAARALAERRIVEAPEPDGGGGPDGGCVAVPVLAGDRRPIAVLGLGLRGGLPLDRWDSELFHAAADLAAVVLLGGGGLPAAPAREPRLTPRQRDVLLELVEHGAGNERIGRALGLSARTVKIHLQAVYRELGVRSRGEAIRLALTRHPDWLERERAGRRPDRRVP